MPRRKANGEIIFPGYPEFTPNLTPREIFKLGSFGGTYWRPIYSKITKKNHKNVHKKYPKSWLSGIPDDHLTRDFTDYDKSINKYNVKVGTTLEFWEKKKWITKYNPYGWVHWYFDFYKGKRTSDDARQIYRWNSLTGENGRFKRQLINMIKRKNGKWNDEKISPAIRQTLQHWAYKITANDLKTTPKTKRKRGKTRRRTQRRKR